MAVPLPELAEDAMVHMLPRPGTETVLRDDLAYLAGTTSSSAQRLRLDDVEESLEWVRAQSRLRSHREVEWWIGWSATPHDLRDRLLRLGLVPDPVPTLTAMTCVSEPPAVEGVVTRRVESVEENLETVAIDWEVWQLDERERAERHQEATERWPALHASGVVQHYAAFLDGHRVGFARAVHTETAVVLLGGAVLPEARGRGVYRALVRARWDDAVARGTPTLVVQAGSMSGPVLAGLGFVAHGEIRLLVDRL